MLACHDMFKYLQGNPTSITMMASIHYNPLTTNLNTLAEMYKNIKTEKTLLVKELDCSYGGKFISKHHKNIISLNVAAEISVKLLEESHKQDMHLLYFLGCLPGGVSE